MDGSRNDEPAVLVRGVCKKYGKKDTQMVLDHLNMTVNRGTIYTLLGASGCGKTTLLSAIVGCRKYQEGHISLLGKRPGEATAKSIGYMPQDIALVGEFTIKGALQHFGWIFGMENKEIEERYLFLEKLFDLPASNTYVKHLSGGQQRRLSMAIVLIHNPPILILDEPTVGLDPLLRQNIWDYLLKITEEEKKTVIITTHYIEEAKQAHKVGLMRNGKILAEGNPQELLDKHNCLSLEDLFLHLCQVQREENLSGNKEATQITAVEPESPLIVDESEPKKSFWERISFTNKGHAKALISKNVTRYIRHPGTLAFAYGFPLLQMSVFFLVVGVVPKDLKIGVVNEELGNYRDCSEYTINNRMGGFFLNDNETCAYKGLGCKFLDILGEKFKNTVYFKSREEAITAVKRGDIRRFLHFPHNYSQVMALFRSGEFDETELDFRDITFYQDVKDYTLSLVSEKELYETYKKFTESLAMDCNTNPHFEKPPISFQKPIYGKTEWTYTNFAAPGMILVVSAFLAMGVSSLTIITERTEGVWERTLVAGVTEWEIVFFHTLTLCFFTIFQILELFVISFYVFQMECLGDKVLGFFIIYIQVISSICLGILISVVTKTVTESNYTSLGLFYPFLSLTGCVWPLEGIPPLLRYFSYFVPVTLPVESFTYVMYRGWGIERIEVYKSFLSSFAFLVVYVFLTMCHLRKQKNFT